MTTTDALLPPGGRRFSLQGMPGLKFVRFPVELPPLGAIMGVVTGDGWQAGARFRNGRWLTLAENRSSGRYCIGPPRSTPRGNRSVAEPVNPARLDVLTKPRRRRAVAVPAKMKPHLAEAKARALARPAVPGLLLESTEGGENHPTYRSPWVDRDACDLMLADCFATRSVATFQSFLDQIASLCRKCWDDVRHVWVRDEGELNQALNFRKRATSKQ